VPFEDGSCDSRFSFDELTPLGEGSIDHGLKGILNHVVEDYVDFGSFEDKHDLPRGQVSGMALETASFGVERRALGQ
jgi:hypothetical protein